MDEKMFVEVATKAALWAGGILLSLLGYFLHDAHKNFKDGLEKKADRDALDNAFKVYRQDMHAMEDRHKEETARLERQYEIRFAGVINQFSERISSVERNIDAKLVSVERNMGDKMDMVIDLIHRSKT